MVNQILARKLELGERSYNILVGDKLSNLGKQMSKIGLKGRTLILSHPRVMYLHGKPLIEGLRNHFETVICEIPEGERSKSEKGLSIIYNFCQKNRLERKDIIICFGGGVIGDLGGYAGANWSGGINIVQVPTTLVAQVDSSIGGKTGIDWGDIKNKIRIFKQPKLVFADITTLPTLSQRQFSNGMAEVIKYGLLDERIWDFINLNKSHILSRNPSILAQVVWECANLKCNIVEKDEFDQKGIRANLNLGHTVGHGIEGASKFKLLHGEAISLGLISAAILSTKKFQLSHETTTALVELLEFFGLPTRLGQLDKRKIIELIYSDKKVEDGKLCFVLFEKIGDASFPHYVTEDEVRRTLTELS